MSGPGWSASAAAAPSFKIELVRLLPTLRAFAMSLAKSADRADDLVQDTVVKAWSRQSTFEPGTNLKAWLFTILRNQFYSQIRKRSRELEDGDGSLAESLSMPAGQEAVLYLAELRTALGALPAPLREALILVGASGFSYEEAAEICRCAVGTVKSRVSRARRRLRAMLDAGDDGPGSRTAFNHQTTHALRPRNGAFDLRAA
jgi:RNA polymerase sigma-70 factor (ECF subfamily)